MPGTIAWRDVEYGDQPSAWRRLPRWTSAMAELGVCLAAVGATPRYVVAVGVTTRKFASVFFSLGYVTERFQVRDFTDRFSKGDLVVLIQGKHQHLAEFQGYRTPHQQSNVPGVSLQLSYDEPTCTWWRRDGTRLVRYSGKKRLRKNSRVALQVHATSLASAFIGPKDAAWVSGQSLIGFVGDEGVLRDELSLPLRYDDQDGRLADVVVPDGTAHFASSRSERSIDELREWAPEVVVFDGATSFGKWRHEFKAAHHVVILDRSLPPFEAEFDVVKAASALRKGNAAADTRWPDTTDTSLDWTVFAT